MSEPVIPKVTYVGDLAEVVHHLVGPWKQGECKEGLADPVIAGLAARSDFLVEDWTPPALESADDVEEGGEPAESDEGEPEGDESPHEGAEAAPRRGRSGKIRSDTKSEVEE